MTSGTGHGEYRLMMYSLLPGVGRFCPEKCDSALRPPRRSRAQPVPLHEVRHGPTIFRPSPGGDNLNVRGDFPDLTGRAGKDQGRVPTV